MPVIERFEAVTQNMKPSGLALEIEILAWPDQDARSAAVAALASKEDVRSKLGDIPTKGYVWVAGGSVGYSIRYAHRAPGADGHDRVTLVVGPALGSYTFEPWKIGDRAISTGAEYSVIELDLTGAVGHIATPSEIVLDEKQAIVALAPDAARQPVLTGVRAEAPLHSASGGAALTGGGG